MDKILSQDKSPAWPSTSLYNEDLEPASKRNWRAFDISTMWMSVVHNLGQYTIAAGLFILGLSPLLIFFAYLAAFTIMYVASNLMGVIGQRSGVPYPVVARITFGVFGSNIPAMARGIAAIFWYGIQTYLAAMALITILVTVSPFIAEWDQNAVSFLGLSSIGWVCFVLIWAIQLFVVTHGMETVRRFQNWAGPIIWAVMLILAISLVVQAHGDISLTGTIGDQKSFSEMAILFGAGVFAIVASLATLILNISDFTRFSPTERSVRWGNFWGLPINGAAFGIVAALCTAGALAVYGEAFTDPANLIAHQENPWVVVIGALLFLGATMGVNIAGNVVSPAYDLANLLPSKISFKTGAIISSVVALVVLPWKVYSSPALVIYFLGSVGALLGPFYGIMIWDYYRVKKQNIDLGDLYIADARSRYYYSRGFNVLAIAAFIPTAAITIPMAVVPALAHISAYSWPVGVILGAFFYAIIIKISESKSSRFIARSNDSEKRPASNQ